MTDKPNACESCAAPANWTYDEAGPDLRADAARRGAMIAPAILACNRCHDDAQPHTDPNAWTPIRPRTAAPSPGDRRCAYCGRPLAACTVPGLHGMIRDRAAAAADR
jgi:hypothetical protein